MADIHEVSKSENTMKETRTKTSKKEGEHFKFPCSMSVFYHTPLLMTAFADLREKKLHQKLIVVHAIEQHGIWYMPARTGGCDYDCR